MNESPVSLGNEMKQLLAELCDLRLNPTRQNECLNKLLIVLTNDEDRMRRFMIESNTFEILTCLLFSCEKKDIKVKTNSLLLLLSSSGFQEEQLKALSSNVFVGGLSVFSPPNKISNLLKMITQQYNPSSHSLILSVEAVSHILKLILAAFDATALNEIDDIMKFLRSKILFAVRCNSTNEATDLSISFQKFADAIQSLVTSSASNSPTITAVAQMLQKEIEGGVIIPSFEIPFELRKANLPKVTILNRDYHSANTTNMTCMNFPCGVGKYRWDLEAHGNLYITFFSFNSNPPPPSFFTQNYPNMPDGHYFLTYQGLWSNKQLVGAYPMWSWNDGSFHHIALEIDTAAHTLYFFASNDSQAPLRMQNLPNNVCFGLASPVSYTTAGRTMSFRYVPALKANRQSDFFKITLSWSGIWKM